MNKSNTDCPTCFTVEDWESLGRDRQIQWWQDHQFHLRTFRDFEKDALADAVLFPCVFSRLTTDNIHAFLQHCPASLLEKLDGFVASLPPANSEDDWPNIRWCYGAYYPPSMTDEEIRQSQQSQDQRLANGIRVFHSQRKKGLK